MGWPHLRLRRRPSGAKIAPKNVAPGRKIVRPQQQAAAGWGKRKTARCAGLRRLGLKKRKKKGGKNNVPAQTRFEPTPNLWCMLPGRRLDPPTMLETCSARGLENGGISTTLGRGRGTNRLRGHFGHFWPKTPFSRKRPQEPQEPPGAHFGPIRGKCLGRPTIPTYPASKRPGWPGPYLPTPHLAYGQSH